MVIAENHGMCSLLLPRVSHLGLRSKKLQELGCLTIQHQPRRPTDFPRKVTCRLVLVLKEGKQGTVDAFLVSWRHGWINVAQRQHPEPKQM